ncbi:hypothetical conserved protein [Oceanobacillus iheyensis HTE831]|uniref:Hypothetical conserved protein n=1 Tax=Oceanobacillus iheyensis (strain DSM 14371 / CIP 107618 / JCM 11309 / KCTC 3954 / HTE831) TaxID=221109 RepID=Q8ERZ4_OCEIH|nr:tryptophan transporter [Oceanobacillus iheyensis]BAC13108.1 hypothetical conserved protein [Oceanobacillus iheyensis HTE831]
MNTRILMVLALLVSIGAVLHTVAPPMLFGVKPDMLLAMMFLGIVLFPKVNYVLILSFVTGFISALTTAAPGGQIANIIDKPITALIFLSLFLLLKNNVRTTIVAPILTAVGTIISGTIFLSVTLFLIGLMEGGFFALFASIVLPATIINTVIMIIIYPIIRTILKRSGNVSLT